MKLKSFLSFFLAFVFCVPIGTVSHEVGHYAAAKCLGYKSTIHYSRANWSGYVERDRLLCMYRDNEEAINNNQDFIGKKEFEDFRNKLKLKTILVTLGGVLQTVLVGTIGFILLFRRRDKFNPSFKIKDWTYLFMSLFWLRQVYNVLHSLFIAWYYSLERYCGGDELKIAALLDLPNCSISYALGLIGAMICGYSIFFLLPKKHRIAFIIAGVLGSGVGYYLWMKILGPILMP